MTAFKRKRLTPGSRKWRRRVRERAENLLLQETVDKIVEHFFESMPPEEKRALDNAITEAVIFGTPWSPTLIRVKWGEDEERMRFEVNE